MDRSVPGRCRGQQYAWYMERRAASSPSDPAVVVAHPDQPVTPEAFRDWLDRRQSGEPLRLAVRAADTLAESRSTGDVMLVGLDPAATSPTASSCPWTGTARPGTIMESVRTVKVVM